MEQTQQKTKVQTKQQPQTKQRADSSRHCPNCHAELEEHAEFCPVCGKRFVDYCTFCGASMTLGETVCEECGMPVAGVKCPKCGTLNLRPFCSHCNEPLNKAALRAVEKAKQDPKVQQVAALMDKAAELEEKMEQKETADLAAVQQEYEATVKEINETFEQMLPPNGSTPQEQFNYSSARKVAVEATRKVIRKVYKKVPTEWVCNYCGCHHNKPSDCVKPHLGGIWIYKGVYVDTEVTETYTTYKHV